jgi:indolepyruvate ferredoxin oxidoreductase beta subunit
MIDEFNMMVAGVGGQGSILFSHILGNAAIAEGYQVRVAETYGAAMRGGAVSGHIRIGSSVFGSVVRRDHVDLLIGLEPLEGLRLGVIFLSPEGTAIINTRPINPIDVNIGNARYPEINVITTNLQKLCKEVIIMDGTSLAEEAGDIRTLNVVMLGAAAGLDKVPLSKETLEKTILVMVPPRTREINKKAFVIGWEYIKIRSPNKY